LDGLRRTLKDGIAAGAVAAVVSGAPSTSWALVAGRDPLEPTLAAGALLLPREQRRGRLVAAAVPVHLALSIGWAVVLAALLPRRRAVSGGALAGFLIVALDLGIVGWRSARVRPLPLLPQVADHVLYGATVGFVLDRRR
jgi:hypothetical protein